jgi:diadenosine tetraphosphate (Ap4A) HIT family hydrolase
MSASNTPDCPFCQIPPTRIIEGNNLAYTVPDAYPVSRGHTLIIPRRHVTSFFDLTVAEVGSVFDLLDQARARLDRTHGPDGYNVGINIGHDAGQTILHVHVHLIPRYAGDVPDPEGGVRNIIPGKGRYR